MERKHGKGLSSFKTLTAKEAGKLHHTQTYTYRKGPLSPAKRIDAWSAENKLQVRMSKHA